jgi:hypothetical protein
MTDDGEQMTTQVREKTPKKNFDLSNSWRKDGAEKSDLTKYSTQADASEWNYSKRSGKRE